MGYLIFPMLLILAGGPAPSARTLGDFSRFSKAINQEIAIVELDGTVREGILEAVSDDQVSVRFGGGTKTFSRASVASAERMRDGRADGAAKGALFGLIMGLAMFEAYPGNKGEAMLSSVAVYSGIGFLVDAAQTHREPLYRSPASPGSGVAAPKPSLSLSFRF